jgi:hypothetical protein
MMLFILSWSGMNDCELKLSTVYELIFYICLQISDLFNSIPCSCLKSYLYWAQDLK